MTAFSKTRFSKTRFSKTGFSKTASAALAALVLATTLAVSAAEARPRFHRGHGVGLGIVGALAVGGLIAAGSHAYGYDEPERRCDMVERVNRFGEVVGYRRVCSLY